MSGTRHHEIFYFITVYSIYHKKINALIMTPCCFVDKLTLAVILQNKVSRQAGRICTSLTSIFIWFILFWYTGGRGANGSPIIVFPEFPTFAELEDQEFHNVLTYLTSVPRCVFWSAFTLDSLVRKNLHDHHPCPVTWSDQNFSTT